MKSAAYKLLERFLAQHAILSIEQLTERSPTSSKRAIERQFREQENTHVSMAGGKYNVPFEELDEFHRLYSDAIVECMARDAEDAQKRDAILAFLDYEEDAAVSDIVRASLANSIASQMQEGKTIPNPKPQTPLNSSRFCLSKNYKF